MKNTSPKAIVTLDDLESNTLIQRSNGKITTRSPPYFSLPIKNPNSVGITYSRDVFDGNFKVTARITQTATNSATISVTATRLNNLIANSAYRFNYTTSTAAGAWSWSSSIMFVQNIATQIIPVTTVNAAMFEASGTLYADINDVKGKVYGIKIAYFPSTKLIHFTWSDLNEEPIS